MLFTYITLPCLTKGIRMLLKYYIKQARQKWDKRKVLGGVNKFSRGIKLLLKNVYRDIDFPCELLNLGNVCASDPSFRKFKGEGCNKW